MIMPHLSCLILVTPPPSLATSQVGDLQCFYLEADPVDLDEADAAPELAVDDAASSAPLSIRSAWRQFITSSASPEQRPPPAKRRSTAAGGERSAVLPSATLADKNVRTIFQYPSNAVPPPRLATFALPSRVHAELLDRPHDVCFCLTLANGSRVHGAALQICEQMSELDGEPSGEQVAGRRGKVVLRALVLLSRYPVYELWRTMLHTIYSRGEALGPGGVPLSSPVASRPPPAQGTPHAGQAPATTAAAESSPLPSADSAAASSTEAAPSAVALLGDNSTASKAASAPAAPAPAAAATVAATAVLRAEEGGAATKSAPRTPTNAEARPEPLAALLSHTAEVLAQSEQELRWLTNHPLWLPTALAPLFSSLRWQPAEIAYLLAALLSDQKVLLHSEDPHRLYHATCALKALISPLSYGHIFIPLLPTLLMSADEAEVLLVDCSTPYLIGCETSLLASFGTGALPSTAVVVSLDRGIVRRAPGTDWFDARAPPFASLCAELQRCMGGGGQPFRGLRAQAACLRFVVDVINIPTGFLASSPSPCDADALSRFRLLEAFAADAHARCKQHRSGLDEAALGTLEQSLHQSTGYLLAQVCAEAATRHHGGGAGGGGGMARGAGGATAGDGGAGGGGDACRGGAGTGSMGALGEWNALIGESVEAVGGSAARSSSCCLALSKLYEAGPFREWWGEAAARTGAAERLQWLDYRAKGVDLIEYLRENHRSMKVIERGLEGRLHAIWADTSIEDPASVS
jgi:hypothetical protein